MSTVDPSAVTTAARRMSWTIWLIGLSILAFLVWSAYARIDQIVRGPGEIVSSSKPQIIQNLEGGILAELNVSAGDEVSPGTVLGRLHETSYRTQVDDLQAQIAALEIRQLRLEAEMNGLDEFVPSDEQDRLVPEIVKSESALLRARLSDYASRRKGAAAILKQAKAERDMLETMFEREVEPLIEVTKARKAYSDAEAQLNDITTKAKLERASDYSETLEKLGTLRQQLKLSQDQLARTTLTSPMHGIVNKLSVTTIGGVVRPGE